MHKEADKRVVITGIGPVTSIGTGRQAFWSNLLNNHANIRRIPARFENDYIFKSKYYAPFPEFTLEEFGFPSRMNMLMEEPSKLAVIGTKLALQDAGIDPDQGTFKNSESAERIAVVLGNAICSLEAGFEAFANHTQSVNEKSLKKYDYGKRFNRMVIPAIMPDSAAAWVAIHLGICGETFTLNTSCASGTYAIGEAYRKIVDGYADMVVTGGVECLKDSTGTIMRGFDTLSTLTKSENGFPMPFSKNRSGFLFAEGGGCILILERLDKALKRNTQIYAEIGGYESSSDAYNLVQIEPSGKQIKRMLNKLISDNKIDYFNTHGTATTLNDEFEKSMIQEVFGKQSDQPLINSTKGTLGHTIGASGAIEAAVTAMSIKYSKVHRNESEEVFDNLNLVTESMDAEINNALSASYGFGGHNAALLLKKWSG
jgi:3-oxoacyl-[acyl-carrier-protein] synthase II